MLHRHRSLGNDAIHQKSPGEPRAEEEEFIFGTSADTTWLKSGKRPFWPRNDQRKRLTNVQGGAN